MRNKDTKYLIISPVRNESEYIENTLISVTSQTVQPSEWVIVDDGSTDDTVQIINKYQKNYPWIRLIERKDRGYAEPGRGVMDAFYTGYENKTCHDFDFVVKLDGDLTFAANYFESLLDNFAENPQLGIAGGYCYIEDGDDLVKEDHPKFHVRGPTKVYRRACWDQIDGLVRHLGWDTIDEVKALYHGWQTESFEDLKIIHHKVTGFKSGRFRWAVLLGRSDFYVGYHPVFMLAKMVKRLFEKPLIFGSIGIGFGYYICYFSNKTPILDKSIIQFLRREQLKTLMFQRSLWNMR